MIADIFEYIKAMWSWMLTAFEFLLEFISGQAQLATLVYDVAGDLPGYLLWLPAGCTYVFATMVVVVVFYKFFGRT